MRNVSIIMLIVAGVLGAVAVIGVRALLLSSSQQTAQAQVIETIPMSTIVVANMQMDFGTEIEAGMLREIPWAAAELPAGAFQTVGEIVTGADRVVLRSIAPGQLILSNQITGAGERAAMSQFISEGMRAVSLRVNEVSGAAGFILPGDFVDVLLTVDADRDRANAVTHVILQNVRVLAMDQVADVQQGGSHVARVATLEVGIEDGQRIALASSVGSISLALRNVDAPIPMGEPVRSIRFTDLEPDQGRIRGLASDDSGYTMMTVTRELQSSSERVIRDQSADPSVSSRSDRTNGTP